MGFISGIKYKYSRKSAENQFSQHPAQLYNSLTSGPTSAAGGADGRSCMERGDGWTAAV